MLKDSEIPMIGPDLGEHQIDAKNALSPGKVLYGGVGSGKTRTACAYYVENEECRDFIVITTARKRDSMDWESEALRWGISTTREYSRYGKLTVDSWNNIDKYVDVEGAFFVFDEQRAVGSGKWSKSLIKIGRKNHWIMLSGTPGDDWVDYRTIFIAAGFYKNKTDFDSQHIIMDPWAKFPKIKSYRKVSKLEAIRNHMLVEMPYEKSAKRALNYLPVGYDAEKFEQVWKKRWNVYEDKPIKDAAEMVRLLRRIQNSDPSRLEMIHELAKVHKRLIIFYNFDYELEILRTLNSIDRPAYEYNGHVKDPVPDGDTWFYIVQYQAGAEAWNCTSTDAMILYSLNYSYRNFEQVQGRIDRMNTPFSTLYYYIFVADTWVDRGIRAALSKKQDFNERKAVIEAYEKAKHSGPSEDGLDDIFTEVCEI